MCILLFIPNIGCIGKGEGNSLALLIDSGAGGFLDLMYCFMPFDDTCFSDIWRYKYNYTYIQYMYARQCTCRYTYICTLHKYMYMYVLLHIYKYIQRFEGSFHVLSQARYSVYSAWTCLCVHTTYYSVHVHTYQIRVY